MSEENSPRCPAEYDGFRCTLPDGHDCIHTAKIDNNFVYFVDGKEKGGRQSPVIDPSSPPSPSDASTMIHAALGAHAESVTEKDGVYVYEYTLPEPGYSPSITGRCKECGGEAVYYSAGNWYCADDFRKFQEANDDKEKPMSRKKWEKETDPVKTRKSRRKLSRRMQAIEERLRRIEAGLGVAGSSEDYDVKVVAMLEAMDRTPVLSSVANGDVADSLLMALGRQGYRLVKE